MINKVSFLYCFVLCIYLYFILMSNYYFVKYDHHYYREKKVSSPNLQVLELQNLNCSIHEVEDTHARSENGQLFSLVGALLVLFLLILKPYSYICFIADQVIARLSTMKSDNHVAPASPTSSCVLQE